MIVKSIALLGISLWTFMLHAEPPSLKNCGNTCYLNAAVQCLYSITPLMDFLKDKGSWYHHNSVPHAFIGLINAFDAAKKMPKAQQDKVVTHVLEHFVDRASDILERLAGTSVTSQSDIHEFLNEVLNEFLSPQNMIKSTEHAPIIQKHLEKIPLYSRLICPERNYATDIYERTFTISLPFKHPQKSWKTSNLSIYDLLENFFYPEKNIIYEHMSCTKQYHIRRAAPNMLMFHLQRVLLINNELEQEINKNVALKKSIISRMIPGTNFKLGKIALPCNLPFEISIDQYIEPETENEHSYELQAIAIQSGTSTGGHYVAYVKDIATNKWYLCDDRVITEVHNPLEINNGYDAQKDAYLVIYLKKDYIVSPELTSAPKPPAEPTPTPEPQPIPEPAKAPQADNHLKKSVEHLSQSLQVLDQRLQKK